MNPGKKCFYIIISFFVFGLTVIASICNAQEYPNRAIDIVVPFAAGGGVDTFSRSIREPLSNELKVPVNIVNRPGGGGVVGSSFVANTQPDGYTLLMQDLASFVPPQVVTPKIPYHILKDFQPIAICADIPLVFAVREDSQFKTIEDLISYAKKNPGKILGATQGVGSAGNFELELLKSAAKIDITHLPLGGGGEIIPSLLGGHADLGCAMTIAILKPHIRAGKLRVLVTCSAEKIPDFPEIPTTREKGMPEVNINMDLCILGPKGLSPQVTERLAHGVSEILKIPELVSSLHRLGYMARFSSPKHLEERLKKDLSTYFEIGKKAGFAKGQID